MAASSRGLSAATPPERLQPRGTDPGRGRREPASVCRDPSGIGFFSDPATGGVANRYDLSGSKTVNSIFVGGVKIHKAGGLKMKKNKPYSFLGPQDELNYLSDYFREVRGNKSLSTKEAHDALQRFDHGL